MIIILIGFSKREKPSELINPAIVYTMLGLGIALKETIANSKYKLRLSCNIKNIKKSIRQNTIIILEYDDDDTSLICGKGHIMNQQFKYHSWQHSIWYPQKFEFYEHGGHSVISEKLLTSFGIPKAPKTIDN